MNRVCHRAVGLLVMGLVAVAGCPGPADAAAAVSAETRAANPDTGMLATVPSARTPDVRDGAVDAIVDLGDTVVVGGDFTQARDPGGGTAAARRHLLAFAKATGRVDPAFAPVVNGEVRAVAAGPIPGTVFVAGRFATVNGVRQPRLALLRVRDGGLVAGFRPPVLNGAVKDLRLVGDRLLVGGSFTRAGVARRVGLASLDARTGRLDDYLTAALSGNHNYAGTGARAPVGVENLAVSPDRRHLVVIGNFRRVDGVTHRQIVRFDLGARTARVRDWRTDAFAPACNAHAFDHWVRDVAFAPDGGYFVVVTTGAHFPGTLCDSVTRWETGRRGPGQQPTWANHSGGDTFLSVAVGRSSVFVGGHFRWLNNPLGADVAEPGAVGRASIAALDPASGLPQRWNPGRNPRGYGVDEMHLTRDGLWLGSDTRYLGNKEHQRERIAFLPFGPAAVHSRAVAALPGRVYQFGAAHRVREYDGDRQVGPPAELAGVTADWRRARGAFWVGGTLFYGEGGTLRRRAFSGRALGEPAVVDPYHDPKWDTVLTGSKPDLGQTYAGVATSFHAQLPQVSGMFYADGRLYYALTGRPGLYWRWFDPDSGTVGAVPETVPGVTGLAATTGIFVAGGHFYAAYVTTGSLLRRAWTAGVGPTGPATAVSGPKLDGTDWRSPLTFVGP
ncbi:hypothetical protein [Pilimelia terevasa]|uniref:hypothetical protein n=1 Tax=Pilimelia terevasa TaxID=53372 RepID=UPI0016670D09|nr:hypothetical protein [Pilimelia terevasa]